MGAALVSTPQKEDGQLSQGLFGSWPSRNWSTPSDSTTDWGQLENLLGGRGYKDLRTGCCSYRPYSHCHEEVGELQFFSRNPNLADDSSLYCIGV